LSLWSLARALKISLKALKPWVGAGLLMFGPIYFLVDVMGDHKPLRLVVGTIFWTCWMSLLWIKRWNMFEVLSADNKWYVPWRSVEFSVSELTRIQVRNIDSVSRWYVEKLGLQKLATNSLKESGIATYRFKDDGKSLVLTSRGDFGTARTPILFTKKLGKMISVLAARGIDIGAIKRDRQGTGYFEIRDPEGNVIEIVEEP
jgi:predicted enzyme related to lactoylglutathione lyase